MPATPCITLSAWTSRVEEARSSTIDRPMTIAQPPLKPCRKRAANMTAMVGLRAHTRDASSMTSNAASSGLRRPR